MRRAHLVILTADNTPLPHNMDSIARLVDVSVANADSLPTELPNANLVLVWDFPSNALEKAWPAAANLEWVHVAAAGVDAVIFDGLRNSSVVMTNAKGVFDQPIAEFVLTSILADKQIHTSKSLQHQGVWQHRDLRRTAGTNALIVGTGGIGRATARLLAAAGMNVKGAGRRPATNDADFGIVASSADLAAYAGWADHLILAAPLTQETAGLLGQQELEAMKEDAHVINVGRGALINEPSLLAWLRERERGHASLDVFTEEPLPPKHPFWAMENVTVSAHMSGDVSGWRDSLADQFLSYLVLFAADRPFPHQVEKSRGYVPGN